MKHIKYFLTGLVAVAIFCGIFYSLLFDPKYFFVIFGIPLLLIIIYVLGVFIHDEIK